jgi:adenylosuccinate synthase
MTKKETDILDQLLEIPRGIGGAYHDVVQRAAVEIERLRKERDQARRLVCRHTKKTYRTLKEMAEERGWDCFDKEPTDDQ